MGVGSGDRRSLRSNFRFAGVAATFFPSFVRWRRCTAPNLIISRRAREPGASIWMSACPTRPTRQTFFRSILRSAHLSRRSATPCRSRTSRPMGDDIPRARNAAPARCAPTSSVRALPFVAARRRPATRSAPAETTVAGQWHTIHLVLVPCRFLWYGLVVNNVLYLLLPIVIAILIPTI